MRVGSYLFYDELAYVRLPILDVPVVTIDGLIDQLIIHRLIDRYRLITNAKSGITMKQHREKVSYQTMYLL